MAALWLQRALRAPETGAEGNQTREPRVPSCPQGKLSSGKGHFYSLCPHTVCTFYTNCALFEFSFKERIKVGGQRLLFWSFLQFSTAKMY